MIDQNNELENELVDKNESAGIEASIEEVEVDTEDVLETEEEEEIEEIEEDNEEVQAEILKIKREDISLENFDWSRYNNKFNVYTADERSQMESMYDKTLSTIVE